MGGSLFQMINNIIMSKLSLNIKNIERTCNPESEEQLNQIQRSRIQQNLVNQRRQLLKQSKTSVLLKFRLINLDIEDQLQKFIKFKYQKPERILNLIILLIWLEVRMDADQHKRKRIKQLPEKLKRKKLNGIDQQLQKGSKLQQKPKSKKINQREGSSNSEKGSKLWLKPKSKKINQREGSSNSEKGSKLWLKPKSKKINQREGSSNSKIRRRKQNKSIAQRNRRIKQEIVFDYQQFKEKPITKKNNQMVEQFQELDIKKTSVDQVYQKALRIIHNIQFENGVKSYYSTSTYRKKATLTQFLENIKGFNIFFQQENKKVQKSSFLKIYKQTTRQTFINFQNLMQFTRNWSNAEKKRIAQKSIEVKAKKSLKSIKKSINKKEYQEMLEERKKTVEQQLKDKIQASEILIEKVYKKFKTTVKKIISDCLFIDISKQENFCLMRALLQVGFEDRLNAIFPGQLIPQNIQNIKQSQYNKRVNQFCACKIKESSIIKIQKFKKNADETINLIKQSTAIHTLMKGYLQLYSKKQKKQKKNISLQQIKQKLYQMNIYYFQTGASIQGYTTLADWDNNLAVFINTFPFNSKKYNQKIFKAWLFYVLVHQSMHYLCRRLGFISFEDNSITMDWSQLGSSLNKEGGEMFQVYLFGKKVEFAYQCDFNSYKQFFNAKTSLTLIQLRKGCKKIQNAQNRARSSSNKIRMKQGPSQQYIELYENRCRFLRMKSNLNNK